MADEAYATGRDAFFKTQTDLREAMQVQSLFWSGQLNYTEARLTLLKGVEGLLPAFEREVFISVSFCLF